MKKRLTLVTIAVTVIGALVGAQGPGDRARVMFEAAKKLESVDGDLKGAIEQYKALAGNSDRAVAAKALVRLGASYEKLGLDHAQPAYERVLRDFGDQRDSGAIAGARLAAMQSPAVAQVGQSVRLLWSDLGRWLGNSDVGPPSSDGRYVSFTGPTANLAILDLKTGKTFFLTDNKRTTDGGFVESSAISPDGRYVAYDWDMGDAQREELRVVPLNSGAAARSRSVYVHSDYMDVLGWSPDGKSVLAELDFEDTTALGVISMVDGGVRVLVKEAYGGSARFSPDGRFVAYTKGTSAGRDIFVRTLDGKETPVVEGPADDLDALWSPDGSHIVFRSNRTRAGSLWMVSVSNGTPSGPAKLVMDNIGSMSPLGFTRSGALYYTVGNAVTNVYTAELDTKLNTMAAPSMATSLNLNSNRSGAWSPDGQSLAYLASSPAGTVIRIRSMTTGGERTVPSLIAVSGPVRWFPDGQSLLVPSRDARLLNGQLGYYRVNIASGTADLLHQTASPGTDLVATRPDLSRDGKTIFYLETPEQPVRVDIDSRRAIRLTPIAKVRALSPAVSPDGLQVAYVGSQSLFVAPATGGEPRELIRFSESSRIRERRDGLGLAWSPDQRYLFFVKPQSEGIWRVPAAGGEAENIGVSMDRIRALHMHPDARRIAFDSVIDADELWALENFLPKRTASK